MVIPTRVSSRFTTHEYWDDSGLGVYLESCATPVERVTVVQTRDVEYSTVVVFRWSEGG